MARLVHIRELTSAVRLTPPNVLGAVPIRASRANAVGLACMGFEPLWWCRGGHRMTVTSWARPRRFPRLPCAERRFFAVGGGTYVLADCNFQPGRDDRPLLIALHG